MNVIRGLAAEDGAPMPKQGDPVDEANPSGHEVMTDSEHDEIPASEDEPRTNAGIDVAQDGAREAEHEAPDDTNEQKTGSANSRRGNPKWIRGPYYEPLGKCLRSKAKVLEENEKSLRDWSLKWVNGEITASP